MTASLLLVLLLSPAPAKESGNRGRSAVLTQVVECRGLADPATRLACFDRTVAALDQDERARRVVVVDQAQVRETRRQLFGFGGVRDPFARDGDGDDAEQVRELATTVRSARRDPYGKWVLTLADGAVWHQLDATDLVREPKAGSSVVIRRQTLGNYRAKLDGQLAIRVRREG